MKFSIVTIVATCLIAAAASPMRVRDNDDKWPKRETDDSGWGKRGEVQDGDTPWSMKKRSLGANAADSWSKREEVVPENLDWYKREEELAPYKRDDEEDVSLLKRDVAPDSGAPVY
ncbi:hypothetical protein DL96DRAFT_810860 [Flagelloscypha sp. PMI_526]|nr:hypothetical protein DL96DRAFT_810860 [Flagelloscypha sp. PMI_526]